VVAFGVDDVDVPAGAEGEVGQPQEGFGLAGAGEPDEEGAEAEVTFGDGGPPARVPAVEITGDPGSENGLAAVIGRGGRRVAHGLLQLGTVLGLPAVTGPRGELVGGDPGDLMAGQTGEEQADRAGEGQLGGQPGGPTVGGQISDGDALGVGQLPDGEQVAVERLGAGDGQDEEQTGGTGQSQSGPTPASPGGQPVEDARDRQGDGGDQRGGQEGEDGGRDDDQRVVGTGVGGVIGARPGAGDHTAGSLLGSGIHGGDLDARRGEAVPQGPCRGVSGVGPRVMNVGTNRS
jgi:hypothetical protein